MNLIEILVEAFLLLNAFAFVSGFLVVALSGSVRAVKIYLVFIAGLGSLAALAALFVTTAFVYLLFQYITIVIIFCFAVIAGAACGYGVYLLLHRQAPGQRLTDANLDDYLPAAEFASQEGIDEDKVVGRIRAGFYTGGRYGGKWYVSRSESSRQAATTPDTQGQ